MRTLARMREGAVEDLKPGEYKRAVDSERRYASAITKCPDCGKLSSLGRNHAVAADGTVTPSYVCPHPPCAFHAWVRLLDWEPLP